MAWVVSLLYFQKASGSVNELDFSEPQIVYVEQTRPLPERSVTLKTAPGSILCSCVAYAKYLLGIPQNESLGDAWKIKPNSEARLGSLILLPNHVGVVTGLTETEVTFKEANFERCKAGERTLDLSDKSIRGYRVIDSIHLSLIGQ